MDQRALASASGLSLPTIQRMEASTGNVRGVVETLIKVVEAFDRAGVHADLQSVTNGEELLVLLQAAIASPPHNGHPQLPDLLLLDLNMPKKDGREALREIRATLRQR